MTVGLKRKICILLTLLVFAFVCYNDCTELGRFMHDFLRASTDADAAISVISTPAANTDAMVENRGSGTQPVEFRTLNRQAKKSAHSTEQYIFLVLLVIFILSRIKDRWFSDLFITPGETRILRYIMLQDGKK